MAWRSSGSSNLTLVSNLAANGLIKTEQVKKAMLSVDRAHYTGTHPYDDSPQGIGHGATISAPHMHADACETLLPFLKPGSRILDVGSGSGYLTHVLASITKPGGNVIGIDHVQALVELARKNVGKTPEGRAMLESGAITFVKGDGRLGYPNDAPFDAIHVGAAASEHHQSLVDQLNKPGRLFIPVEEDGIQSIYVTDKDKDGNVKKTKLYGVRYVPLTNAPPA